ncbi:hypothetical protein HNR35_001018 [Borreliella spielmanii]|uniref:Uncharacterized protein n=1 Tax=Borreliella spielmanii TaxID=88916 RepID=A0ABR6P7N0_9SPIR|nr:hypothetical protein [Borreliella spielmanii]MBB6032015.1 hypothetical protein [Borreliella spielmanii]
MSNNMKEYIQNEKPRIARLLNKSIDDLTLEDYYNKEYFNGFFELRFCKI